MSISPKAAIVGIDTINFMRNLERDTLNLTFHDDNYDLRKIKLELESILEKAKKRIEILWLNLKPK